MAVEVKPPKLLGGSKKFTTTLLMPLVGFAIVAASIKLLGLGVREATDLAIKLCSLGGIYLGGEFVRDILRDRRAN